MTITSQGTWPLLMALALSCTPGFAGQSSTNSPTALPQPTHINVQEVKSNKGITAWIVESHEIPVVSVALAFRNAGTAADPKSLAGLVHLLASMLDEGAGKWTSQEFKKLLLENNIELTISATQDTFQVNFRTPKKNVDEAFRVLNIILTSPRFDEEPLTLVKNQILSALEQALHNEHFIGTQKLNSLIYGDHPYGKTAQQVLKEFPKITAAQMRQYMKERFARDQLLVSAVGDITPNELKDYLDKTFADLPEKSTPTNMKKAELLNIGATVVETLNIPQSLVLFTQPGIARKDPDFYAAYVLMKILGDGQFESRLWNEVREKRGLAYGIDAELAYSRYTSLLIGDTATKNANVKDVIDIVRKVWQNMTQGATQAELEFVKKRMLGSFALNFSSTIKIAKALLVYQLDDLGTDYINKRNKIISSLTLDQINKVAKSLLKPEKLTFVVVGQPEGLSSQQSAEKSTQEKKSGATT